MSMERDIVSKAVDYYKERNCSQISCHLMSPLVMYAAVIVVIRCIFYNSRYTSLSNF